MTTTPTTPPPTSTLTSNGGPVAASNMSATSSAQPARTLPAGGPPALGILAEAQSLETLRPWVNLGLYGPPGVGKTYLAGEIEDVIGVRNPWYLDVEGGYISIRHRRNLMRHRVEIRQWEKIALVYLDLKYMCDHPDEFPGQVPDAVIIDHVTELQKIEMRDRSQNEVADKRDWNISQSRIEGLTRRFRDLPMHVIFIYHSKEEQEPNGTMKVKPALPGKQAGAISGFLDIVGYYDRVESMVQDGSGVRTQTSRLLFTQPTQRYIAKDRTGLLPPVMENPTMSDIVNPILEEYARLTAEDPDKRTTER